MPLARLQVKDNKRVQLKVFSGLDRRDKIGDSALTEMINMSPAAIPSLSSREERRCIAEVPGATEICLPEYTGGEMGAFTGVRNNVFYYNGKAVSGMLSEGKKSIADFNGKICIFPDKVYYDYLPDPETGKISDALESMEKTITVGGVKFYSSYDDVTGEYTSYISKTGAGFDERFSVGDSLIISGCSMEYNNTKVIKSRKQTASSEDIVSVVVDAVSSGRIDLLLYNRNGEKVKFKNTTESGSIDVRRAVPDMDNICVHNNRLWGTADTGEYIYASKLGDCTNFYSYQGLSEDSWYSSVGTGGCFTGICSYRTAVVAFKRNCIHHVYGDSPINFSIPKQTFGGCIDGRSICEIGGVLYYLAQDGFSAYNGGEPYNISPQLKEKYVSCAAGSNGKYYYASAVREDGKRDVLVYTPAVDIWIREDDTPFEGFCTYNGSVYGIADGIMWKLDGGNEVFDWCVVSKRFTYDVMEHKGLSCMWLRMDLEDDTKVNISVSRDGGDFELCGRVQGGKGFSVYRIPVRFGKCESFRVMIDGRGRAVIHDIEITTHNGGRIYG